MAKRKAGKPGRKLQAALDRHAAGGHPRPTGKGVKTPPKRKRTAG